MEFVTLLGTTLQASRVGLGTWAMGSWKWSGTDDQESPRTIHAALDTGINLIDTAPVYGFGRSEEIVGKAVAVFGHRDSVIIVTKVRLGWRAGAVSRHDTRARLLRELEDS
jgi:aryl-alcohol dehydrogenase-like predicted oxidoreductase